MFTLGLKDFLSVTPHTTQSVTGHNSIIIYVTELKNKPQGACTQLTEDPLLGLIFPLDLFRIL